jgi:phosphoribosyl 1,2-cyclic phosphodiesterase
MLQVIFLGTGCSSGLPRIDCSVRGGCEVCKDALMNPESKNRRGNVSALLKYTGKDGICRVAQIDAGKTFRDSALKYYPEHEISHIDCLLITHEHAGNLRNSIMQETLIDLLCTMVPQMRVMASMICEMYKS